MLALTIIIAVYNDWIALDSCLHSVSQQTSGPDFEVIVVDDGSDQAAPEKIRQWGQHIPITFIRQLHAGISAARNHGIRVSQGSILLFVDADSRLRANCLVALQAITDAMPGQNYFQLRLVGNCLHLAGRSEHLRLTSLQDQMLQSDGRMRYLNTAGFAIRRSRASIEKGLFESGVARGEDTLLLAHLMQRGELPQFASDAIVEHEIARSLLKCFRKEIRSAFLEGATYSLIGVSGVKIRMSHRERYNVLRSMWKISGSPKIGRLAWLILSVRQALSRITSVVYQLLYGWYHSPKSNRLTLNRNL